MTLRISLFLAALASFVFPCTATAALVTYTDPVAYAAQLVNLSLTTTGFTNFDSLGVGSKGTSFSESSIQFTSQGGMRISSGTTSSPSLFLGFDSESTPDFLIGDKVTLTLPTNSRAVSLQIITETIPDITAFATLTVNGQGAITAPGGTLLTGMFRSYFLGVISDSANIGSAVVDFDGTGTGFYRIDDVGVAGLAVPEPSSLVLVLAASMTCVVRRRRLA